MSEENNKQNITIAEIQKDVKYIKEALDRQIESYNGKFRMTDDRITKEVGANKTLIDNHCKRIRELEVKEATTTTKLTMVISGIVFAGVFLLDQIVDAIKHIIYH